MRLIDAEYVLWKVQSEAFPQSVDFGQGRESVLEEIRKAPTVDAEPVKHGKWVWDPEKAVLRCSNCEVEMSMYGEDVDTALDFMENAKYCIECGAKMEAER